VAVLNMDDAGDTVAAVAMSILILTTSCVVKLSLVIYPKNYGKKSAMA